MAELKDIGSRRERRKPYALYCAEPSLTKQSFKDECDINQIIDRASSGANITHLNERVARYGDFTQVPDYRTACDVVNRANGLFMELDAKVRERFGNDPGRMVAFLTDPQNYEEAVKLGFFKASEPEGDAQIPSEDITPPESNPRAAGAPPAVPKAQFGGNVPKPQRGGGQ